MRGSQTIRLNASFDSERSAPVMTLLHEGDDGTDPHRFIAHGDTSHSLMLGIDWRLSPAYVTKQLTFDDAEDDDPDSFSELVAITVGKYGRGLVAELQAQGVPSCPVKFTKTNRSRAFVLDCPTYLIDKAINALVAAMARALRTTGMKRVKRMKRMKRMGQVQSSFSRSFAVSLDSNVTEIESAIHACDAARLMAYTAPTHPMSPMSCVSYEIYASCESGYGHGSPTMSPSVDSYHYIHMPSLLSSAPSSPSDAPPASKSAKRRSRKQTRDTAARPVGGPKEPDCVGA